MTKRWLPAAVIVAFIAACGGGNESPTPTSTLPAPPTTTPASAEARAIVAEADDDPSLPGEYIDLPAIYGAPYPYGPPPPHQDGPIDYSAQGLPPAGGLHWGPSAGWTGPCPEAPASAPLNCGPVPWGIYREPWHAESLVHNLEHAGFVIWYNTNDQAIVARLEAFAQDQLTNGILLVLAPYADMDAENVAITVWSRRDIVPAGDFDEQQFQEFIDTLNCRFDPEGFC